MGCSTEQTDNRLIERTRQAKLERISSRWHAGEAFYHVPRIFHVGREDDVLRDAVCGTQLPRSYVTSGVQKERQTYLEKRYAKTLETFGN